jgi:hypothetical protein
MLDDKCENCLEVLLIPRARIHTEPWASTETITPPLHALHSLTSVALLLVLRCRELWVQEG